LLLFVKEFKIVYKNVSNLVGQHLGPWVMPYLAFAFPYLAVTSWVVVVDGLFLYQVVVVAVIEVV